jgi:hypothetical protein
MLVMKRPSLLASFSTENCGRMMLGVMLTPSYFAIVGLCMLHYLNIKILMSLFTNSELSGHTNRIKNPSITNTRCNTKL